MSFLVFVDSLWILCGPVADPIHIPMGQNSWTGMAPWQAQCPTGPITLISLSATQWPLLSPRPAQALHGHIPPPKPLKINSYAISINFPYDSLDPYQELSRSIYGEGLQLVSYSTTFNLCHLELGSFRFPKWNPTLWTISIILWVWLKIALKLGTQKWDV